MVGNTREEWRDIKIANGDYQISNLGRVKSVKRRTADNARFVRERILKTRINKQGYEYVNLQICGKRKAVKIHREVAKAFLANPNNYAEVNHKDENKANNVVDNLEWCDRTYNARYGTARARAIQSRMKSHLNEIDQYTLDGVFVKRWISPISVEKETKKQMRATNIIACCRRKTKKSYGYIWRYKDDVCA